MSPQLEDGALVYRCTTDARLPAGTYDFRLSVAGLTPADGQRKFTVADDGDAELTVAARFVTDRRRVTLTADPSAFDPMVKTLVFSPDSRLDRLAASDWLRSPAVSAQRKALVLNVLAKLRCVPSTRKPLIANVQAILGAQNDRLYVRVTPDLSTESSVLRQVELFRHETTPLAAIHKRLLLWIRTRLQPAEPQATPFALSSFRQASTTNSLQVVLASADAAKLPTPPPAQAPGCYADLDIDLGGSLTDVVGLIVHLKELAGDGLTDHVDLHDRLVKDRDLKNYLYYTVEQAP
jgi:hypothetical protein